MRQLESLSTARLHLVFAMVVAWGSICLWGQTPYAHFILEPANEHMLGAAIHIPIYYFIFLFGLFHAEA